MKAKSILIIIVTLLIGFFLGWLTSAQVRLHKLQPVRFYFSEEHFREGFYKTIQPDEKQKAEIEKILDKYAKVNSSFQQDFRKDLDSNMKAFRKELDSKLTKEQLLRIKEMDERRQEMIRQSRRGKGDSTFNRRMRSAGHGEEPQGMPFHGEMQGPPPPPPHDTTGLPDIK
ncbi:MAG: hypothetical protein NTW82_06395 [Bacteroidia bacterium]|nr:hypothetical protein [Bacteroidia bacterium]